MANNSGYTPLPVLSPEDGQQQPTFPPHPYDSNQAFAPQQGYPQQGYSQQGYPQQGYPNQQVYPPPGYAVQGVAQVAFPPQPVVMQALPHQNVVYVNEEIRDPLLEAVPFIPTYPISTQIGRLPRSMWKSVSTPKTETFNELKLNASWTMVWFMLFVKVIAMLCIELIVYSIIDAQLQGEGIPYYETLSFAAWYTIISVPISFFLTTGFLYLYGGMEKDSFP